ncbi:prophage tail fiber N-terminal domain-containing protein [Cedecea sp.]|jgi:hypothetical protein|uniref:prophage tail fiber N-terminal domain-containing protein n=1 Tax=Cedecea sp. TaxID=1970739 RepID=UPI002F3FB98A
MALISGVFKKPDGTAVGGVTLHFTLTGNTRHSFYAQSSEVKTDEEGRYSAEISSGHYIVKCFSPDQSDRLGVIYVEDGAEGSLNDFLLTSSPVPEPIVAQMQQMYFAVLALSQSPAAVFATAADVPADAAGYVLVTDDETKGVPALYLYANGRRYWLAMMEDTP